jgi:DNA-binding NarL/FixJ family response regulator
MVLHTAGRGIVRIVVADPMAGVRDGLRWVLSPHRDVVVVAEAATVAGALEAPGAVVCAGLRFPDGTAADLCAAARPVVVVTWLPADERSDVDLGGAAAVLRTGGLRDRLADALRVAGGCPPPQSGTQ